MLTYRVFSWDFSTGFFTVPAEDRKSRQRTGFVMKICLKRAYEEPSGQDGYRVLTERLWPRGVSKDRARIDQWAKEWAPSTELRKWYGHEADKWPEFQLRYRRELSARATELKTWAKELEGYRAVTFVFGSKGKLISSEILRQVIYELLDRPHLDSGGSTENIGLE